MKLILAAILMAIFSLGALGDCPAGAPASPLCMSQTVTTKIKGNCEDEFVSMQSRAPCCNLAAIANDPNGCPSTDGSATCRYVELNKPFCSADKSGECIKGSVLFTMSVETGTGTCCESCSCWGDPHCESFDGKNDTWILCDSRVKKPYGCGLGKQVCLQQKDHMGNDCRWIDSKKPWNVGLKGSQCVFDMENQAPPVINMYEFNNFKVEVDLGERGILTQLKVKSRSGNFYLTSDDCFDDFKQRSPFRKEEGAAAAPSDPLWLGNQWVGKKLEGGDIEYSMSGFREGIVLNVRCARTAVPQKNGVTRFGPPRLNVAIVEPGKGGRGKKSGFCVTSQIDKAQSTHEHTDKVEAEQMCADAGDELYISKLLCGSGVTRAGVPQCKKSWCNNVRPGDVENCLKDIKVHGWRTTFCAANTGSSQHASGCAKSLDCQQCKSDISDFGWAAGVDKWTGQNTNVVEGCVSSSADLPSDLIGCQKGIRIQYEEADGSWTTHRAIPKGYQICDGGVLFDSIVDFPIFTKRVRIAQCNADAACIDNQDNSGQFDICNPEDGFKAQFNFVKEEDELGDLKKLLQSEDLICNPAKWNTPDGCLEVKPDKDCYVC